MSLRIISKRGSADGQLETTGLGGLSDNYMDRLIKLVPTEAVTAYPLLSQKALAADSQWAILLLAWALLVVVIAIRWNSTATPGKGPQWTAIIIAVISFVIWVYASGGDFGFQLLAEPLIKSLTGAAALDANAKAFLVALAFVLWTVLAPLFYKGE